MLVFVVDPPDWRLGRRAHRHPHVLGELLDVIYLAAGVYDLRQPRP
jgi:hypothetical protein